MKHRLASIFLGLLLLFLFVLPHPAFAAGGPPASRVKIWCLLRIISCDKVTVFNDLNSDGQLDSGENFSTFSSSIASVSLTGPASFSPVALAANGQAAVNLIAGTYTLTVTPQAGWTVTHYSYYSATQSFGGTGPYTANLSIDSRIVEVRIGLKNAPVPTPPPPGTDSQLTLSGYFIAQSGFQLNRIAPTTTNPTEAFIERPDFILTLRNTTNNANLNLIQKVLTVLTYTWNEYNP